jgi:hypothetical protein
METTGSAKHVAEFQTACSKDVMKTTRNLYVCRFQKQTKIHLRLKHAPQEEEAYGLAANAH